MLTYDFSFLAGRRPGIISETIQHVSAVCIPLTEGSDGDRVLFEKRAETLKHQPGDVCFPGGRVENGEKPEEAAVREIMEELLVEREQVEILGPLDILAIGFSQVHPYACRLRDYHGCFNSPEVDEVFQVPLAYFLETEPEIHEVRWKVELGPDFPVDKIHGGRDYPWRERIDRICFYEYDGHVIWGMTAKIMYSFVQLLRARQDRGTLPAVSQ